MWGDEADRCSGRNGPRVGGLRVFSGSFFEFLFGFRIVERLFQEPWGVTASSSSASECRVFTGTVVAYSVLASLNFIIVAVEVESYGIPSHQ